MASASDKPFSIRLPTTLVAQIQADAKRLGVSRTAWIEQACRDRFGEGPMTRPPTIARSGNVCDIPPPGTPAHRATTASVPAIAHSPDDKVKASDCPHPTSRRIGDGCGVCGATVKGGK